MGDLRYRQLLAFGRDNSASNGVSGGIFACAYPSHFKIGTMADDFRFAGWRWAMVAGDGAGSPPKVIEHPLHAPARPVPSHSRSMSRYG